MRMKMISYSGYRFPALIAGLRGQGLIAAGPRSQTLGALMPR
jgi:hypothetical protein